MPEVFNVYCDESCHLEHDHQRVMVLGAVWCHLEEVPGISRRLKEIKTGHGMAETFEIKWRKVSPGGESMYLDFMDYFFDDDDLHFRCLIVPDKSLLRHDEFRQNHDTWYYEMYFDLMKVIIRPDAEYHFYLDIKDTRSSEKVARLHDVLAKSQYDFSRKIVRRVQTVRSEEVQLLQLTDLLIGAISYANRGLSGNRAKLRLVQRMRERSGYRLDRTTLLREEKVNIFRWHAAAGVSG